MANSNELACTYSALILADDDIPITVIEEKLSVASRCTVYLTSVDLTRVAIKGCGLPENRKSP